MARKSNPKLIGGFVVGAIALLVVGVLTFGGGQYFSPKGKAVLYFQGSLSGLDVGSPVTFRGVKVGSVTAVVIQYDIPKHLLHIPVYIELDPSRIQIVSGQLSSQRSGANLKALVQHGMRAQLQVTSLITGQASVDFDFYPGTPIRLVGLEQGVPELPTIPSDIDILKANITSVLAKISKLPLEKISDQISEVLTSTNQTIKDAGGTLKQADTLIDNVNAQVKPLTDNVMGTSDQASLMLQEARARLELKPGEPLQNLNALLADAQRLVNNLDRDLPPIIGPAVKVLGQTSVALDQATSLIQAAQRFISPGSPIYYELNSTLTEFKGAARAIRVLAEYLQRNPAALLKGNK